MKLIKRIDLFILGCAALMSMTSCNDDSYSGELRLSEPTVTEIKVPTATVVSEVFVNQEDIDLGNIRVMAYGFCYDTAINPTIYNATIKAIPDNGKITASLTELQDNTVYHVRAFATLYPNGVVYSNDVKIAIGTTTQVSASE